ncbi:HpcH/HpaI aldolase/citrate lyase family protein [Paenarthrobacter sp. NPDC091711]|uniref:HpcH/HpaI aldolase/citrate lyase family protein n=1 Tax=Paenarthrobacter sp. NPDC091711 TaxID=3364385 RepID=UPI00382A538D
MPDITWLFVPGDRAERFAKAATSGANQIICDLEDAVGIDDKEQARTKVVDYLSGEGRAWVRINSADSAWHDADIEAVAHLPGLQGVMVPKAENPEYFKCLARTYSGLSVIPLIETAVGAHRALEIASTSQVRQLAFGSIDYSLDTGVRESDDVLLSVRHSLVAASRIAEILPPLDGVTKAVDNAIHIFHEASRSKELGFSGKLCIHPRQIPLVRDAFRPSDEELSWARRVLDSVAGKATAVVDGAMVDKPVIDKASRIVAMNTA